MENASNGLLIAGIMLIGIIIITLAVYMFSNVASFNEQYDIAQQRKERAVYNSKFEKYNSEDLTIHDIISVVNLANEYNSKFEEKIEIWLFWKSGVKRNLCAIKPDILYGYLSNDRNYVVGEQINNNSNITKKTYKCSANGVTYTDGIVSKMKFEEL